LGRALPAWGFWGVEGLELEGKAKVNSIPELFDDIFSLGQQKYLGFHNR
jgi:hypothetical protein